MIINFIKIFNFLIKILFKVEVKFKDILFRNLRGDSKHPLNETEIALKELFFYKMTHCITKL